MKFSRKSLYNSIIVRQHKLGENTNRHWVRKSLYNSIIVRKHKLGENTNRHWVCDWSCKMGCWFGIFLFLIMDWRGKWKAILSFKTEDMTVPISLRSELRMPIPILKAPQITYPPTFLLPLVEKIEIFKKSRAMHFSTFYLFKYQKLMV